MGWGGRGVRPQAEHGLVISYICIINRRSWLTILLLVCAEVSLGLTV